MCYNDDFEKLRAGFLRDLPAKIKRWAVFLGENQYVIGDYLTYVDFLLYDVLQIHTIFEPSCLNGYSNLKQFVERIEKLPNIVKYHNSGNYHALPYTGIIAKWGNKRD